MTTITFKREIDISVTPEEVALQFTEWGSDEQARFLNAVAQLVKLWDRPFCFQLQYLTDEKGLTREARSVMQQIGEYSGL